MMQRFAWKEGFDRPATSTTAYNGIFEEACLHMGPRKGRDRTCSDTHCIEVAGRSHAPRTSLAWHS